MSRSFSIISSGNKQTTTCNRVYLLLPLERESSEAKDNRSFVHVITQEAQAVT